MQEWIIAMLVISVLLIVRDMAKTILSSRWRETDGPGENHPQKEKVEKYAASFQKLADTFYGMPYRKDYLSAGQLEGICAGAQENVCTGCYQWGTCWGERRSLMEQGSEALLRSMEDGGEETLRELRGDWAVLCGRSLTYIEALSEGFQREKQNLIWGNRMIENRLAVAQQLSETSRILKNMAADLYEITKADPQFCDTLKKRLRKHQILLGGAWVMDKVEGRRRIFLSLRARGGQCIAMSEAAQVLSELCQCAMAPADGSRCIINGEFHTIHFVEDASYQMLYGVARLTREEEQVSGDNYICRQGDEGKFVLCLSDGMGSGRDACRESEMVVELLEQFLESGFSQESAARMVNSALVLNGREGMFSTLDLCAVDLYSGICSFLKAGASATFIRRDHWVEAIESESLAAGLIQQMDFELASRKLYHGDYLIMMTDGVLDALPKEREEETMKEIILDVRQETPKDMSRGILERVLGYSDYHARDDMTVLVAGLWKK
jgi:stage II sporulation protein E